MDKLSDLHIPSATPLISVFISYAREDRGFVNALVEVLKEEGIEVYGDWLLTGGESYKEQLRQLIINAEVFITVISPDFLASDACKEEVDLAAGFNKTIIPVSHQDHGDDARIYTPLKEPQWIFIRTIEAITSRSAVLLEAIRTDFHLLPQHRDLLVASDNWKKRNRDSSYLLRKSSLKSAEEWLARVSALKKASPKPTTLQVDYILASQAANRQQNRRLFSIYTFVIVAIAGLAIYANSQRIQTQESLDVANENMATSIGVQANRMILQRRKLEALNLLVASRDYPVNPEIISASLSMSQPLISLNRSGRIESEGLEWIKSSPDGRSIVGGDGNRALHLYRMDNNRTTALPEFEARSKQSVDYAVSDSAWWFAGEEHGLLKSFNQADTVRVHQTFDFQPNAIQWGNDEAYAVIGLSSLGLNPGELIVLKSDAIQSKTTLLKSGFNELSLDESGRRLAASNFGLDVFVWETSDWEEIVHLKVGQDLRDLDEEAAIAHPYVLLSPNGGKKLAVQIEVNEGVMLLLYDVDRADLIATQLLSNGDSQTGKNLSFSPDGTLLIAVDQENVFAINTDTGANAWTLPVASPGQGVAVDPLNRFVAVSLDLGEFFIVAMQNGALLEQVGAHGQLVVDLDFSADGSKLLSASQDGVVREWHINEQHAVGYWLGGKRLNHGARFSDDGSWMAKPIIVENYIWSVLYQNVLTDSLGVTEIVSNQRIEALAFSTDNRYLILGSGAGELAIWDIEDQAVVLPWTKSFEDKVVAIQTNQNHLFIAASSSEAGVFSIPDGTTRCTFESDSLSIREVIAAKGFNRFALQGFSSTKQYVSEISNCKLKRLPPLSEAPNYISYDDEGQLYLIGSKAIRSWDVKEERLSEEVPLSTPIASYKEGICRRGAYVIVPSMVNDRLLNLQVIDLKNGTQSVVENAYGRTNYAEDNDFIMHLGCSPDGKRAISVSRYDLMQLWGIQLPKSGEVASSLTGMKLVGVAAIPDL